MSETFFGYATCPACGELFERKYKNQRYCKPECGVINMDAPAGCCKWCKQPITDKRRKLYCCEACHEEGQRAISRAHNQRTKDYQKQAAQLIALRHEYVPPTISINDLAKLAGAMGTTYGRLLAYHTEKEISALYKKYFGRSLK